MTRIALLAKTIAARAEDGLPRGPMDSSVRACCATPARHAPGQRHVLRSALIMATLCGIARRNFPRAYIEIKPIMRAGSLQLLKSRA